MTKRNRNTFAKRKRELDRMQKAKEKMARRQGGKERKPDSDASPDSLSSEGS